jgi:hypothetical protein
MIKFAILRIEACFFFLLFLLPVILVICFDNMKLHLIIVKTVGLLCYGFGSTPEMWKKKPIWVVIRMQVVIDRYPTWLVYTLFICEQKKCIW